MRCLALILCLITTVAKAANFVAAPDTPNAGQLVQYAEAARQHLSIELNGRPLPDWPQPCEIRWIPEPRGAGVTRYSSSPAYPVAMSMEVRGPWNEVRHDVIPHEVFHLVLYDSIAEQLPGTERIPRWADEGFCSIVESGQTVERLKGNLRRYLATQRGMPLNQVMMFDQYPEDTQAFYAHSVALAEFLVEYHGGAPKFRDFIVYALNHPNDGMRWTTAIQDFYGYESIDTLQKSWLRWIQGGADEISAKVAVETYSSHRWPYGATSVCADGTCPQPMAQPQPMISYPQQRPSGGAGEPYINSTPQPAPKPQPAQPTEPMVPVASGPSQSQGCDCEGPSGEPVKGCDCDTTETLATIEEMFERIAKEGRFKGEPGEPGAPGDPGPPGDPGKNGRGVEKLYMDPKGNLHVAYTDQSEHKIGNVYDLMPDDLCDCKEQPAQPKEEPKQAASAPAIFWDVEPLNKG